MAYDTKPEAQAADAAKTEENDDGLAGDSGYTKKFLKKVSDQVANEFKVGEDYIREWRAQKRTYLKLYINQRKNPKKVGDTLMFASHQTILASLFKDAQSAEWMGREEEDIDRAEQLNALHEFDYDQMGKAGHDYGKTFDFTGYGIGIEDWSHFDRDSLTPLPDLWDPLNFVFDPKATSINGNKLGRGACRFIYRTVGKTMDEMKDDSRYFNLDGLKPAADAVSDEAKKNEQERNAARGTTQGFDDLAENCYYELVQGYTWVDGKRYLVEMSKEIGTVVRLSKCKTDYWPLQDYRIYPDPHVFLTPGCWDFTEDKQRARAILQNYTLDAAKFDVQPEWLFDKNKIKNKQQLREHKSGKYIEGENIDGNTIQPMQKPTLHQYVQGIQSELEANAQKALATPEIQQGILFQAKQTATASAYNSFAAPTIAATNSTVITTNAYTLNITGAPVKGTNNTVTNSRAVNIAAGAVGAQTNAYGLTVNAPTGATANYSATFLGGAVGIGTDTPVAAGNGLTIAPAASTTGSPALLTVTAPAHTTLTASAEATDVNFNLARTVTFSTGAITTQRAFRIQAPTYAFAGASTITNAATLSISGPPAAGTNATLTNSAALIVESGKVGIGTLAPEPALDIASLADPLTGIDAPVNYQLLARYNAATNGKSAGIAFTVTNGSATAGAAIYHVREGSSSFGYLSFATRPSGGTVTERMRITSNGHIATLGTAPAASSCGTTPAVSATATDNAGKVTIGSGTTTSCTVTFALAYAVAPACTIAGSSTAKTYAATTSTTVLTITSSADMASDVIMYTCLETI